MPINKLFQTICDGLELDDPQKILLKHILISKTLSLSTEIRVYANVDNYKLSKEFQFKSTHALADMLFESGAYKAEEVQPKDPSSHSFNISMRVVK